MKIIFYLGHPAHYHLFKHIIEKLRQNNHSTEVLIQQKDVLEGLLQNSGIAYTNILQKRRNNDKLSIALGLLKKDYRIFNYSIRSKPDLLVGTSTEITHVGKILGIPSIVMNEDDYHYTPFFSNLGYPFSSVILVPQKCDVGKWAYKAIKYEGYHELAYLHPKYFKPDKEKINYLFKDKSRYFLLRFVQLGGHHDSGRNGISKEVCLRIIEILQNYGNVYISSERAVEPELEQYRIKIPSHDIHDALFFSHLYIGDSQTMAVEAAVLGVPSIRFNDFAGEISILEELEHQYNLTFGIKTSQPDELYQTIHQLLNTNNLEKIWQQRRQNMLANKIDVTAFMVWFVENYPESVRILKKYPDYQHHFK